MLHPGRKQGINVRTLIYHTGIVHREQVVFDIRWSVDVRRLGGSIRAPDGRFVRLPQNAR